MLTITLMTLAAAANPGALDDLAWLEGTWVQKTADTTVTEEWIRPIPTF